MKIPEVKTRTDYYPLQGGEDLITPSTEIHPGSLAFSQNYECDREGRYRVIDGYEAFDGQTKPSDASYWILYFDAGTSSMTAGDTVTGETSGATGVLLSVVLEDGTYLGGDAEGYLVLMAVSGDFEDDENLQVEGVTESVANGTATQTSAATSTLHDTYIQAAIEATRANIEAVPGSGYVLGVWPYNGTVYAFRNNAAGDACIMYASSDTGWTECHLGRQLAFTSGGTYEVLEGDVITGATSGCLATVTRVVLTDGTWAGADAEGYFVFADQAGFFEAENLDVSSDAYHGNVATVAGDSTVHSMLPDGRFDFINYNFFGHSGSKRMYGCDGVNPAFEWDGSVFVPIATGMTADAPEHIVAFRYHLFLSFSGGSLQHSSTGDPYVWDPVTGASELGIGDEITALKVLSGPILCVKGRNSTALLYGSSILDWDLKPFTENTGSIEWTDQILGTNIFLDDRGLTTIESTDKYGDYISNTISKKIQPFLKTKIGQVQSSIICKEKGQYRLYFDDMQGICLTLDGSKILGYTRLNYDVLPLCCASGEDSDGNEVMYFGSSDGFVYQLDSGTSFNGNPITRSILTHYNHLKTPAHIKRVRKLVIEMDAPEGTEIKMFVDFSYGDELTPLIQTHDVEGMGGLWDMVDWDEFTWGGTTVGRAEAYIDGSGTNYALHIASSSTYVKPHTLQGVIVHYTVRGLKR